MKRQAFNALYLVCFALLGLYPLAINAQQSAEAGEWQLEEPTPRGPRTYTIIAGKSHIAAGLNNGTKVRGKVASGTDSTMVIGNQEVYIEDIVYVEGTIGRKHLNYLWILVPLILTIASLAGLGFFIWASVLGFGGGVNGLAATGLLALAGLFGLYGTIPSLVLLVDGVVRFFKRLFIPKPFNWTRSPSNLKS